MKYSEWESKVPEGVRGDRLWKMKVYRFSLFISDIAWSDVSLLIKDVRTKSLSDQLYRSVGSIAANLEEGYSKHSAKDRARFYEYSLGSARESRGWYYRGRYVLGEKVYGHRVGILTEIIRMLLTIIPEERGARICEDSPKYIVQSPLDQEVPFPNTHYAVGNTKNKTCGTGSSLEG